MLLDKRGRLSASPVLTRENGIDSDHDWNDTIYHAATTTRPKSTYFLTAPNAGGAMFVDTSPNETRGAVSPYTTHR
jgi:hypothetical protein